MAKKFVVVLLSVTIVASGGALAMATDTGETNQLPVQSVMYPQTPQQSFISQQTERSFSQSANTSQSTNGSAQQLIRFAKSTGISRAISGTTVNLRLTLANGSTVVWGLEFGGKPTVTRGGFSDPVVEVQTSSRTIQSIVESNASWPAARKALVYDLIKVKGTSTESEFLAGAGSFIASQADGPQTMSTEVDLDDDGMTDAILDVEGINTDDDPVPEKKVTTVIQDIDNDGEMETVSSDIVDANPVMTGVARVDTDDDGMEDVILRVEGMDLNADLKFDERTKTKLGDTTGDNQVDSFAETTQPIEPAETAAAEWDLNDDNISDVKVEVNGEDTNGDGRFDEKTTTVYLNTDGAEGYEESSTRTASVEPSLSMSAGFDTDGDGTIDTKVRYTASDSNGDGAFENEQIEKLKDTTGDGELNQALSVVECERGFIRQSVCHGGLISGEGGIIAFLAAPENLSRIGSVASILGTLVQLARGG